MAQSRMKNVVKDMTTLTKEEQLKYAKTFSEGSKELEELLKYMWANGINTFACCAGHEAEKLENGFISQNKPYIMFDVASFGKEEFEHLLKQLIVLNQVKDGKCLKFDIKVQTFSEQEIRSGFVGENETERHSMSIYFEDMNSTNYKELLKIIKNAKKHDNSLFNRLKTKGMSKKLPSNLKDFLDVAISLQSASLGEEQEYEVVQIGYNPKGNFQNVRGKRPTNTTSYFYQNGDYYEAFDVAKGYYTKTKDNKYLTLYNGSVIELEADEIQGLKPFSFDQKDIMGDFDANVMRKIVSQLDKVDNVESELKR